MTSHGEESPGGGGDFLTITADVTGVRQIKVLTDQLYSSGNL